MGYALPREILSAAGEAFRPRLNKNSAMRWLVCFLLVILPALAQTGARPNVLVLSSASTESQFPFKVSVQVQVENRGGAASQPGKLELVLTPQVSAGSKPKSDVPTMWDPLVQDQEVPALQPGESKVLTFTSHFQARSAFKNQRSSFRCNNVDPAGQDISVRIQANLK